MSTVQTIEVVGKPLNADEVTLVIDGLKFAGWANVRVTRGIERMPSDFQLALTAVYPNAPQYLQDQPGQPCELWIGKNRVITVYVDRVSPAVSPPPRASRVPPYFPGRAGSCAPRLSGSHE